MQGWIVCNTNLNLLNRDSDPFIIATIYLLKNKVRPEKKYHNNKNNIGFGANIPISEFLTTAILDVFMFDALIELLLEALNWSEVLLRGLELLPYKNIWNSSFDNERNCHFKSRSK